MFVSKVLMASLSVMALWRGCTEPVDELTNCAREPSHLPFVTVAATAAVRVHPLSAASNYAVAVRAPADALQVGIQFL
jgi:hypothetical protein